MTSYKTEIKKTDKIDELKKENERKLKEARKQLANEQEEIYETYSHNQKPDIARYEKLVTLESKLYAEKEKLQIASELQKSNVRQALFKEVLPIILEVLEKYQGKPHGEKTANKIENEVYEKTNCRFFIDKSYSKPTLRISLDGYDIKASTKCNSANQELISLDNKIQKLDSKDFYMHEHHEYIENVFAEVEKITAKKLEIFKKEDELNKLCEEYNRAVVGNIEEIWFRRA